MSAATLGVVIPCFNEGEWIRRSVEALHVAARTADWPVEVVIVDDGSDAETAAIIDSLGRSGQARVIRQANAGRFEARLTGLRALTTDHVFLLDSRVLVAPRSLVALRDRLRAEPSSAWNAHVNVITEGNPYAAFMYGITKLGWRRYFRHPRVVRFGPEEFDAYPKGTGAFAAPRETLISASGAFDSLFADQRFASDDTRMLRHVAAMTPIGIDPAFTVDYYGRDSASRWLRQAVFRGTTFVDGYVGSKRRAQLLLTAIGVAAPLAAAGTVQKPEVAAGVVAVGATAAAAGTRACGGSARESIAVGVLLTPFLAAFGVGFVRGLVMAARR